MKTNILAANILRFLTGEKVSKLPSSGKRLVTAPMPKHYGFRKQPVLAFDKKGLLTLISLKNAEKKGFEIYDTLGLADKLKAN